MSDQRSVVSLAASESRLGPRKLEQLADARRLALESRRRQQKHRLELKLAELRATMAGVSDDHLAKICQHMVAQEDKLREQQRLLSTTINNNVVTFMEELQSIKRLIESRVGPR
jgi:hypothetical protein